MSRPVRVVAVSVRGAVLTGAWMGLVPGIFLGAVVGAILSWLAGAVVDWQNHLAFTLGVAANLLPFGDQLGILQTVADHWWIGIPVTAAAGAAAGGVWGAFLGGLLATAYNRYPAARLVWLRVDPEAPPPRRRPRAAKQDEGEPG